MRAHLVAATVGKELKIEKVKMENGEIICMPICRISICVSKIEPRSQGSE